MRTSTDCLACFIALTLKTVRRLGGDAAAEERAARSALRVLAEVDLALPPPRIAGQLFARLHAELGTEDPYAAVRRADNERLLAHYPRLAALVAESADPLRTAVKLALAGNVIDLGTAQASSLDFDETAARMLRVEPALDEIDRLRAALDDAEKVLYLADNAGELVLDRLLIETLPQRAEVTLAVRGGPIINDVTVEDARLVLEGCRRRVAVIAPEVTVPGIDLERCGPAFRAAFEGADLIISKGQGNYETLAGLGGHPVCFIFMVKCAVVARAAGREVGDSVVAFLG